MKRTIDPSTIAWVTTIINWRYSTDQVQLLQHEAHVLFGVTDNRGRMVGCQMRVLEEPQRPGYGGRVESASITAYTHATRDGKPYGAVQRPHRTASVEAGKAWCLQAAARSWDRYAKQYNN